MQLADIYDYVTPCFPPEYHIFEVIFRQYHEHMAFMLDCIGACAEQLANSDILKVGVLIADNHPLRGSINSKGQRRQQRQRQQRRTTTTIVTIKVIVMIVIIIIVIIVIIKEPENGKYIISPTLVLHRRIFVR